MQDHRFSRRYFFYGTLLAGAVPSGGFGSTPSLSALGYKSPNEKLNIGAVGVGVRGPAILVGAAATENIVALCDVDEERSARGFAQYPNAKKYKDYRKMFETEGKNIDAVMVATPDHMHTPGRAAGDAAWQARLLRKAVDADGLGSATAGRRGGEVQGGHPDGQPGLESRGHQDRLRDLLVRRNRRREGSACMDRRYLRRTAEYPRDRTRRDGRVPRRSIGTSGWVVRNRAVSIR